MRDAGVVAVQACHSARRGCSRNNVGPKGSHIVGEEKLAPSQADPRLNPASAIGVKPGADLLRAKLLMIGKVAHSHHHTPGL